MKQLLLALLFITFHNTSKAQCIEPINLSSSNINYYNAELNWNSTSAHHYRIRYKIIGGASWSFQNNLDSTLTSKLITNLTPLSNYIWQIKAYCDTINMSVSNWSITDTFTTNTNLCPSTNILYTTNINYNNATANWDTVSNANRYKIHYRILGTTNWLNLGPIYNPSNSILIPLLQQNTTYEWQVLTYQDSTSLLGSLWSVSDTFTTTTFVASPFNPIITNSIDNTICNTATNLSLFVSQGQNEPDIGTSTITSDGGYFNIQSLSMGDSVGYAIMNTSTQTIETTLRAGIIAGQNYAIINSYDSTGSLIGFFAIENVNGGIKVSSTSPNDGNNYTSGFTSEVHFNNLFVNPNIDGPLNFYTDIQSELSDQFNDTTTIMILCATSVSENSLTESNLDFEIYDILGRKTNWKENIILIYKYSNGEFRKVITTK